MKTEKSSGMYLRKRRAEKYIWGIMFSLFIAFSSLVYATTFIGIIPFFISVFISSYLLCALLDKVKQIKKEMDISEEATYFCKKELFELKIYIFLASIILCLACFYVWNAKQDEKQEQPLMQSDLGESTVPEEELVTEMPSESSLFTSTLTAGHYTVGTDIPSGTYDFFAKSGFGNIMSDSMAINAIFERDTIIGEDSPEFTDKNINNVSLFDGDILTVTGTLEVSAGTEDAGEVTPREQELDEIELEYGIFTAGDDFPPGAYNVIWEEGFGNVQTDPYDVFGGINEIFGAKFGESGSLTDEINQQVFGDDTENYIDFSDVSSDTNDITLITEFKNATFKENDLLKIEDLKVKLVPSL